MKVSIGIPFYNSADYLDLAIKSVIFQNFQDWELILIDDGSTDNSLEIANKYAALDQRIRVISDGKNKRLPERLNQIIDEAKYKYIARMDADDIMHPERISRQLEYLIKNNIDGVATSYYTINRNNHVIDKRVFLIKEFHINDFYKGNYYICHPSILAKKEWFIRNRYSKEYDRAEDYELWIRSLLNKDFNFHVIDDCLMFYREDGSINKIKLLNSYKTTLLIFKNYRKNLDHFIYFYILFRNFLKFFLIKLFYSNYFTKILISKRSKFNLMNDEEAKSIQKKLSGWLVSSDLKS